MSIGVQDIRKQKPSSHQPVGIEHTDFERSLYVYGRKNECTESPTFHCFQSKSDSGEQCYKEQRLGLSRLTRLYLNTWV